MVKGLIAFGSSESTQLSSQHSLVAVHRWKLVVYRRARTDRADYGHLVLEILSNLSSQPQFPVKTSSSRMARSASGGNKRRESYRGERPLPPD